MADKTALILGDREFRSAREFRATIVVPLLSQKDVWLEQCVRSALAQTVACEVIVVVSPKTPASNLAKLGDLKRESDNLIIVTQREEDQGFPAAINLGIRTATMERIGLLLSDDWLEIDAVERCLPFRTDIVCSGKRQYAANGVREFVNLRKLITMRAFQRKSTLEEKANHLSHFFLLTKCKVLQVGGLDESLGDAPGIDDYDLPWVLLEHGATVSIVETFLYNKRDHEGERLTTRRKGELLITLEKILNKHGVSGGRKDQLLRSKAKWLGRPVHVVKEEIEREGGRIS